MKALRHGLPLPLPATLLALLLACTGVGAQEGKTPFDPEREASRAGRLLRKKKIDEAVEVLGKALDKAPESSALHLLMARALYLRGTGILARRGYGVAVEDNMLMAEEEAALVLAKEPDNRAARMVTAQARYVRGKIDAAEKEVRAVLAAADDGGAHFLLATILFDRSGRAAREAKVNQAAGLRTQAKGHYRKALTAGVKRAECYRRLGDIAATDGQLKGALPLYRKALSLDVRQAPHRWLLQACPADDGIKLYQAAAAARFTAGDKPGSAFLWAWVGYFQEKARRWAKARDAAAKALKLDPQGQWSARYRMGWCSWWLEERDKASRIFLDLVRTRRKPFCDLLRALGPEGRTASAMMHALAADAVKAGRRGDGRDLSLCLAVVRGGADDWNNYAFLCRETGRYEDAWYGYRNAIQKDPNNPVYLNDGALILHYHLKRDLKLAADLYQRAIDRARKTLADKEATPAAKAGARLALRDASNNLRLLRRQGK